MLSILLFCIITMSSPATPSKTAGLFVRTSLGFQLELATNVSIATDKKVIVFDGRDRFVDAPTKIINNTRVAYLPDGELAVLSKAAQLAFRTSNTYLQYVPDSSPKPKNGQGSSDRFDLYIDPTDAFISRNLSVAFRALESTIDKPDVSTLKRSSSLTEN